MTSNTAIAPESFTRSKSLMGGSATITLVGGSRELLDRAFNFADACESLWSRFIDSSDISQLNWAEGKSTTVDPLTVRLIRAMQSGHLISGGDFDPTLLPRLLAEGYVASTKDSSRRTTLPASATSPGNLSSIRIDGDVVTMGIGTTLDAGGVGKGFTADLVCEFALAGGADGVMAEISGDIVVVGHAPLDTAWHLSIEDPFDSERDVAIVRLIDAAVVTSSQLKRRWETPDGLRHHILDPRTGTSALSRVQTVTVIASTGAHAEALTKSGFLREPTDYLAWLPSVGAAGMVILDDRAMLTSANWGLYL